MINVLIAEDVRMLRRALVSLLELEPDIHVVSELSSGADVVRQARETAPDVAILDVDMPGLDGISAAEKLRLIAPRCRVIILTGLAPRPHVWRALLAGVAGFVLKNADPEQLVQAVREVAEGRQVMDPDLAFTGAAPSSLTPRELQVLRAAAEGADAVEISERLNLSVGTVRNYLTKIVVKLDARNRVDAFRIARQMGII